MVCVSDFFSVFISKVILFSLIVLTPVKYANAFLPIPKKNCPHKKICHPYSTRPRNTNPLEYSPCVLWFEHLWEANSTRFLFGYCRKMCFHRSPPVFNLLRLQMEIFRIFHIFNIWHVSLVAFFFSPTIFDWIQSVFAVFLLNVTITIIWFLDFIDWIIFW